MGVRFLIGDALEQLRTLPDQSVHCCVTSPPYFGLRDYGVEGQIGLEETPDAYVQVLVQVFREVRRVLRDDGTLWLNLGDSYAGSGRGGNPEAGTKQGTNKGSQTVGVLYGRDDAGRETERQRIKAMNSAIVAEGLKPKDLIGIPWRVAFALQSDGWYLRSDIIWHKPNPMPESVRDRPTSAHEHVFLLSKATRYFFDQNAVREADCGHGSGNGFARVDTANVGYRLSYGGRGQEEQWKPGQGANIRNVWTITPQPYKEAHFATFAPALAERCIKAGCPSAGTVLDPFGGAGTTGLVADRLGRSALLIELNPEYAAMAEKRIRNDAPLFAEPA